jgi:threonine/homoserine/homoserine lactone efflux protein
MAVTQLVALGGVVLLAAMSPGPDFAIVTRNAMISGRRAGMACGVGIAVGVFAWAVVTALGIAGLLAASAVAFTVVKLIGAAYLVLLGVRALLAARRGEYAHVQHVPGARATGALAAFRQGLVTNLLNPKVVLFFLSLMPQFIPTGGSVVAWTMLLTAILVAAALSWFALVAVLVVQVRGVLTRPGVARAVEGTTGAVFIGLAGRLALERP